MFNTGTDLRFHKNGTINNDMNIELFIASFQGNNLNLIEAVKNKTLDFELNNRRERRAGK